MNLKHILMTASLLVAAGGFGQGVGAVPITFNTALPLSDGEVIVREQVHYTKASDVVGGMDRQLKLWKSITALGYGVNEKLAVFAAIPLIDKDMKFGGDSDSDSGLADMKIFARYRLYGKDGPGQTTRIGAFAGLNLPTGKFGQTGDGSTDVWGGLVITHASTRWSYDGQIKYTANGAHNGFARGDSRSANLALQYRINRPHENVQMNGFLYTVLEGEIVYAERDKMAGVKNLNSGGTTAFIAPGLQYATKRWIGEAAVKIPVVRDLHGTALQPGATLILSSRFNF